jgi:ketosteroid isomerase-like protein
MSQQNVDAVRKAFEAFQRSDWEEVVRDADPEIEVVQPPDFADAKTYHGHQGFLEVLRWWPSQWADFTIELTDVIDANDDQVVLVTRERGRGKASGVQVVGDVAFVSTFRDGKIIRIEMFQTLREALDTVGVARLDGEGSSPR